MKYIDADRLKAEIERLKGQLIQGACAAQIEMETNCKDEAYNEVLSSIASLQQEQPEVQNGKFVFPKYLYARTKDNKTIDMSYAPQDMTAVEYIRNDFVEQEQPEVGGPEYGPYARQYPKSEVSQNQPGVELEEEIQMEWESFNYHLTEYGDEQEEVIWLNRNSFADIARYFYELGLNARKEE